MGTLFRAHHSSRDGTEFNHHCSVPTPGNLDRNVVLNEGCRDDLNGFPENMSLSVSVHGGCPTEGRTQVEGDYFDGVFKYIQQMLMDEDDLEHIPYMFQDCMALQAAEKSFYDALTEIPPPNSPSWTEIIDSSSDYNYTPDGFNHHRYDRNVVQSSPPIQEASEPYLSEFPMFSGNETFLQPCFPLCNSYNIVPGELDFSSSMYRSQFNLQYQGEGTSLNGNCCSGADGNRGRNDGAGPSKREEGGKRAHNREDGARCSKQFAAGSQESSERTQDYDKALLCPSMNPAFYEDTASCHSDDSKEIEPRNKKYLQGPKRGRPKGSKKGAKAKEIIDLNDLLARCAQAEAANDKKKLEQILKTIKQYATPYGDATERVAHCFAGAIEARAAGTGTTLYTSIISSRKMSAADYLKAYQVYITACPFKRMSNIFANKSIARLTREAEKIHIIDFGILYGFQWPCIIHGISLRPGGPPKLRITGIDFPQPGFRPAERVEETGRRLENFAKRFNVPFEYNAIAKKWETITPEDLRIERDELLVANCLYRLKNVSDETVVENNNPRDYVLRLIKKIKPEFFVHGIVNGLYNAPFFTTRFREAYFHFSAMFDMFEATMPREDEGRMLVERELLGRDVLNVIACEGSERVERPETYKQWQMRNKRAGFRQLPLNQELMKEVKAKVRMGYHRDFSVEDDGEWMLQSWKGRVIYALSLWRPV